MHELKQSTATTILIGPFLDDTDGKTPETTIDVTTINCDLYKGITKSDLSLTASGGNNDCVHVANGYYSLELTTGNTDTLAGGRLTFNVSGSMPLWEDFVIIAANAYNSLISGTDALHADMMQIGGSTQSQIDLKDLVGVGYNPISHKLFGLEVCDTTTTNTDMRGINPLSEGGLNDYTSTTLMITNGSSNSGTYVGCTVITFDTSNNNYPSVRTCIAYNGSGKEVTLDRTCDFSVAGNDTYKIYPTMGYSYPPTATEIRTEMDNNSTKMAPSQTLADYKATGFATSGAMITAQNDLDIITGLDGVTLATAQALYAPNKIIPDAAGVVPTATEIRTEMENTGTKLTVIKNKTDNLPSLPAPASEYDTEMARLDVAVSTRNAIAPNVVIPDVAGTAAALHAVTDGKIDVMDAIVDAIKVKTDNLPSGITKGEALPKFDFLMVLSNDHITGAIGKTITGEISKDGGSFTGITNIITEVSNGMYTIASGFTSIEMNANIVTLKFDAVDCDTRIITIVTN